MKLNFRDYVPEARYDNLPWTVLKVEESPAKIGPWTEILSQALVPLDADPKHPQARAFSVTTALVNGWYRIKWLDAGGDYIYTDPLQNTPPDAVEYLPSLSEVGITTLGRTRDDVGNATGTFTATTMPTDDQVKLLTLYAGDDVRRKIGTDIPDDLRDDARRLVALRTAMLIELTMFGSEVATDRSPYPQFKDLYKELLADVMNSVAREEAGASALNETGGGFAAFSFPLVETLLDKRM